MESTMRPCPWCKGTDLSIVGGAVILPKKEKYVGLYGWQAEVKCKGCGSIMTQQSNIRLSKDWAHAGQLAKQITIEDWNNREKYLNA